MESLFVYGNLKKLEIEKKVIKRSVDLSEDSLKRYKQSTIYIDGEIFTILIKSNDSKDFVFGFVLEVTEEELKKIDKYETDIYQRKKVILSSGKEAWVYIK